MNLTRRSYMVSLIFVVFVTISGACFAKVLPVLAWEKPLATLVDSLTGENGKHIVLIGLFVAGGLLVFGGDLTDFARRMTWLCLAVAVLLMGSSFLHMFNAPANATYNGALVLNKIIYLNC